MANATSYLQQLIIGVNNFILAYEQCVLLADRISADSNLATAVAAAATAQNRPDVTVAVVNNFNSAVQLLQTTLDSTNAQVNTGGTVRLAFYAVL